MTDSRTPARPHFGDPTPNWQNLGWDRGISEVVVVHATSAHRWNDARIFDKECRSLASIGVTTWLVAQHASHDEADAVRVVGTAVPRQRLARATVGVWRCYRQMRTIAADIYHIHDPELLWVGLLLRVQGKSVVYDAHENLPLQIRHKQWVPSWAKGAASSLAGFVETALGRRMSGVVAATPEIGQRSWRVPVATVRNFPDLSRYTDPTPTEYNDRDLIASYVGSYSVQRGALQMVEGAGLSESCSALELAGVIPEDLLRELGRLPGWRKVRLLGFVDPNRIPDVLERARVGLLLLHPSPAYVEPYATKMFEYMSAGIPFLASDIPTWRARMDGWGCCVFVDAQDGEAVAAALEHLLANPRRSWVMGQRGRRRVRGSFDWATEFQALLGLYSKIIYGAGL